MTDKRWSNKRDLEARCRAKLARGDYENETVRRRLECHLNRRKTTEMSPSVAARYQRLLQLWHDKLSRPGGSRFLGGAPLPFEITMNDPGYALPSELAAYESWFDDKRYYAATMLNRSRAYWMGAMYLMMAMIMFWMWAIGGALHPAVDTDPLPWSVASVGTLLAGWMWWYSRRVDRAAHNIFERESGRVYLFQHQAPHRVLNFYDLYFCFSNVYAGRGTNVAVQAFEVDPDTGEHGLPVMSFTLPTEVEARIFWLALVRWMDKDWPLEDVWYEECFDLLEWDRSAYFKYRVEGVRFEDGTAEWLLPGETEFRIGPWYENLPRWPWQRNKVFREMESAA
jgi:hypothetical protein